MPKGIPGSAPTKATLAPRACEICGTEFTPRQKRQVLCGDPACKKTKQAQYTADFKAQHADQEATKVAAKPAPPPVECRECGTEFVPARAGAIFCGTACRDKDQRRKWREADVKKRAARKAEPHVPGLPWATPDVCAVIRDATRDTPAALKAGTFAVVRTGNGRDQPFALRLPMTGAEWRGEWPAEVQGMPVVVAALLDYSARPQAKDARLWRFRRPAALDQTQEAN